MIVEEVWAAMGGDVELVERAVIAARVVADPDNARLVGVVLVLFRGDRVVAVIYRPVSSGEVIGLVAGADRAVLIVLGAPGAIGALLAGLPDMAGRL
ncbi:hypothetical protein, partial [Nocardia noduli]|uniref:hypothetical protein n=1 Tax=Nocardia noduli TaxID=2815722 RepID=UPI001C22BD41